MRRLRTTLVIAATAALGVASAAAAQAAPVTVALWNMGDKGTTMADASGHGHTGTLHGVAVQQAGYDGGKAFGFSGTPTYVSVPSATDLDPGTANFSFTLHVRIPAKPSSSVGDFDVMRKGLASTPGGSWKVEVLETGRAFCDFRGSSAEGSLTAGPNLADNAWHTVTCSRTPTTVSLAVDGATSSKAVKTGTIANTDSLLVGARTTAGGDQYAGVLDKVSIKKG